MIVVDASALVSIGDDEADADLYLQALELASAALVSPVNAVEAGLILIGRGRLAHSADFDLWLASLGVTVDEGLVAHADVLAAYLAYGRSYHPARLNFGDCFAYALAKRLNAPLLYKGDDFARTDIRSVLQPT